MTADFKLQFSSKNNTESSCDSLYLSVVWLMFEWDAMIDSNRRGAGRDRKLHNTTISPHWWSAECLMVIYFRLRRQQQSLTLSLTLINNKKQKILKHFLVFDWSSTQVEAAAVSGLTNQWKSTLQTPPIKCLFLVFWPVIFPQQGMF